MKKSYIVMESFADKQSKKVLGGFDTYEQACIFVETLERLRIPFCSIIERNVLATQVAEAK